MDSEAIQNFCAVTGADPDVASGYLQVSDNNADQAISLYFENGGQPLQSTNTNTTAAAAAASIDTDEVRAPIESRRDVLVDYYDEVPPISRGFFRPGIGGGSHRSTQASSSSSIFNQRASVTGGGGGSLPGVMPSMSFAPETQDAGNSANVHQVSDSDDSEGYDNFLDNAPAPSTSISMSRRNLLADLFKPPFEIIYHGDLQSARRLAQSKNKWIMINLQDVSEFSCQALNRDVWKQEIVKEVVGKNFVFMQFTIDTREGASLANMYNAQTYPFIAVVHPKTGELRQTFTRYKSSTDILEDIANFLHDNPAKQSKPGNRQSNTSTSSSGGSSSQQQPPKKVEDMTEDEQLARAIAASELETKKKEKKQATTTLHGSDSELSDTDNSYSEIESIDSSTSSVKGDDDMDIDDVSKAHEKMAEEAAGADAWYWSLPTAVPAEPELGPAVTRIQLRFPNGKRVVRRFAKADKVIAIFQFLKAMLPEAAKDVPEAQFMNQRLSECIGQTIEEAKLVNASVAVDI